MTERPQVGIETREATTGRVGPKIRGALVLEGERHGRRVTVRVGSTETASRSEVSVVAAMPEFEAKSRDGKVRLAAGAPESVVVALKGSKLNPLEKSHHRGRPGGHQDHPQGRRAVDWLCDLWLAERLAER